MFRYAMITTAILSLAAFAVSSPALADEGKKGKAKEGTASVHRERGADGAVDSTGGMRFYYACRRFDERLRRTINVYEGAIANAWADDNDTASPPWDSSCATNPVIVRRRADPS